MELHFIEPGKPVRNAFIESFNDTCRHECLSAEVFTSVEDARARLGAGKVGVLQFFSWPGRRVPLETVYARALARIEVMDRSGYDAVWLAEHHFTDYSVCPSIHRMAMHVAGRTRRLRIGTAVWMAATSPEAVRWAAAGGHAILMDPHSTAAEIGRKRALYAEQLRAHGHAAEGREIPVARLAGSRRMRADSFPPTHPTRSNATCAA